MIGEIMKYQKVILVIVVVVITVAVLYFGASWLIDQLPGHVPRTH